MDMSEFRDYKPNSHKSKEETEREKRVEKPVVSGPVTIKKKSEVSKFASAFISGETSNLKNHIVMDLLVPTIKKTIYDIFVTTMDTVLFGGNGNRGERRGNSSYVSYNRYSDRSRESSRYEGSGNRSGYSYNDIIFNNRGEAEEVLSQMDYIIEQYRMVSVADLFDLVGESCNFTDQKYGWTNLRNAEVVRVRDGYMIKLPKALPFD